MDKRLVRHPKVYVRDTGLLHALLGLASPAAVEGHPKCGASWEGFCIEQILRRTDDRQAWFWATHSGAELDLLLLINGRKIGFEFKYSDAPRTTIAFKGQGLGDRLMMSAFARAAHAAEEVASWAIVTDPKDDNARRFYEEFGFSELGANRLFMTMKQVTALLSASAP